MEAIMSPSSSNTLNRCRECGTPLSPAAPGGFCPCCLIEGALRLGAAQALDPDSPDPATALEDVKAHVGVYDLLEEIGRGGMGVVYRARQRSLNRILAVKMILSGQFAGKHEVLRFRAEAEMAAKLSHPNIVAVHESGEHGGKHYFSMDLVQGRSLAEIVRDRGPLPGQLAAAYARTIADAIQYAHQQGVLHRDLKPSNVLIDSEDRPRITDFGLARHLRDDFGLTVTGQLLGSPNFMSPEQASCGGSCNEVNEERPEADQPLGPGHVRRAKPGPLTDIYGIGAILYHSLTGRPPFQAASVQEVLLQLREAEPVSPRRLNPSVPRDLETICLKCLEKAPLRRYRTAKEVADELSRFLNNEPLLASPVSSAERVWRWCKRKPVVAALAMALNLALALGLAGILWEWRRAVTGELTARQHQYVADMNLVKQVWDEGNLKRAQGLLGAYVPKRGQPDLRGFEWRYLWKHCRDESRLSFTNFPSSVEMVLSPGRTLAAAGSGRLVKLIDLVRERELDTLLLPQAAGSDISALAFSPADTNTLATACGKTVFLWDLAARRVRSMLNLSNPAVALAISGDGKLLAAAGGNEQTLELWSLDPSSLLWVRNTPTQAYALQFAPDGRSLLSGGGEFCGPLLWDLASGNSSSFPNVREGMINMMVLSPNGQSLATGSTDSTVILWDLARRELLARLIPPIGGAAINAAAFSADGRFLVAGYEDSTVRLWDLSANQQQAVYRGHRLPITGVAFSVDRRTILSSSEDGTVRLWDVQTHSPDEILATGNSWLTSTVFSPDGGRLATVGLEQGVLTVWDMTLRSRMADLTKPSITIGPGAVFSPNGKILAQLSDDRIKLWDAKTFAPLGEVTNGFDAISLSFSPNSRALGTAGLAQYHLHGVTNRLAFWDLPSMKRINKLAEAAPLAVIVRFSHNGRVVAIGYLDGVVRLWDYATERLLAEFKDQKSRIWSVEFSSTDAWLVAGGDDGAVVFYDVHARKSFRPVTQTSTWILGLCFTPDGKTLVSAEGDGTMKFWQVGTREIALSLRAHQGQCTGVSFSPDGNLLASCGSDGTVRLWPATPLGKVP
jgi:WD40 repeat protein/serine/threonine protein kinase